MILLQGFVLWYSGSLRADTVRDVLESSMMQETRIDKLDRIIEQCRFGIHDISKTELDVKNGLPRFNMPLELGIFLGAKRYGTDDQKNKRCVILDREQYRFQMFMSDLAGMDIKAHSGDPRVMVKCIRDFLVTA